MRWMVILLAAAAAGCQTTVVGNADYTDVAPPGAARGRSEPSDAERALEQTCRDLMAAYEKGDVAFIWEHLTDTAKVDRQRRPIYTLEQFEKDYARTREQARKEAKGMVIKMVSVEANHGSVMVELGTGQKRVQNWVRESGVWKYRPWKR